MCASVCVFMCTCSCVHVHMPARAALAFLQRTHLDRGRVDRNHYTQHKAPTAHMRIKVHALCLCRCVCLYTHENMHTSQHAQTNIQGKYNSSQLRDRFSCPDQYCFLNRLFQAITVIAFVSCFARFKNVHLNWPNIFWEGISK